MSDQFDRDAIAKIIEGAQNDPSLRVPEKQHAAKPMDDGEVSPRDIARIKAQQNMEKAISRAQEANCGLDGSLQCREAVATQVQNLPQHKGGGIER